MIESEQPQSPINGTRVEPGDTIVPDPPSVEVVIWRAPGDDLRMRFSSEVRQAMLRNAYQRLAGADPAAPITRTEWGKPVVDGAAVSLTHCRQWIAAAACRQRVGIDLEVERLRRFDQIAARLEWPDPQFAKDPVRFYQHWTLWEALLKAQRRSARPLMDGLPAALSNAGEHHPDLLTGTSQGWFAASWYAASGLRAAVVAAGDTHRVRITTLEQSPVVSDQSSDRSEEAATRAPE